MWLPEINHKITAHFQGSDFSSGPIVSETISGVLEMESVAYTKEFERIVCITINYNLLIWSQSVTHRGTWLSLPTVVLRLHTALQEQTEGAAFCFFS